MSKRTDQPRTFANEALRTAERVSERLALTPRLSAARQWALWSIVLLLVLSGAVWLWAEYAYTAAEGGTEAYEIKHYAMIVHAAVALLFVFAAGTLLYTHMLAAWRQQRNRITGVIIAATALLLTVSGFGLWYAGGELLRNVSELTHWITGFAIPLVLLAHAIVGRRNIR